MNKKLRELAKRREYLVIEAEKQRTELTGIVEVWRPVFSLADQTVKFIELIKKHPVITLGLGTIFLKVIRPTSIGKWLGRGWLISKVFRNLTRK
jgi:hypothetical protein